MSSSLSSIRNSINWSEVRSNTVLLAWLLTGIAGLLIPVVQWHVHRQSYYKSYGYYVEYEQQQQEYDEAQNNNNDNNDDNQNGSSYYKDCGWWNLVCKQKQAYYANYYGDGNDNDNQNQQSFPSWFLMMGGQTEEMSRWQEENTGVRQEEEQGNTTGQVIAVVWMMLLFVGVLGYGAVTLYKREPKSGVLLSLAVLLQILVLNLFMLPSLISTENRMFEDSVYGWYGQTGVLMAYMDFWWMAFSVGFLILFGLMHRAERKRGVSETINNTEGGEGDYYQAPKIELTSA